jgi:hypothetical protein
MNNNKEKNGKLYEKYIKEYLLYLFPEKQISEGTEVNIRLYPNNLTAYDRHINGNERLYISMNEFNNLEKMRPEDKGEKIKSCKEFKKLFNQYARMFNEKTDKISNLEYVSELQKDKMLVTNIKDKYHENKKKNHNNFKTKLLF